MKLRELLNAIRLNEELKLHKFKLYLYIIDLDRIGLKEPKWTTDLVQKFKDYDVSAWNIKSNTIEISVEIFGVEE